MDHREGEVVEAGAGNEDTDDGQNEREARVHRRSTGRDAVFESPEEGETVESHDGGDAANDADDSRETTLTTEYGTPQGAMGSDNATVMDRILQALNSEMHQRLENYRRELDEANAKAQELKSTVQGQERQITALKDELSAIKAAKSVVEKERDILTEECASARFDVDAIQTELLKAQHGMETKATVVARCAG